ncbi:hypothetical protein R6Q59_000259 [Mikania micrantha]
MHCHHRDLHHHNLMSSSTIEHTTTTTTINSTSFLTTNSDSIFRNLQFNGRASLGDTIYKNITVDHFDPDHFLSSMDLSSEHKILDLKNRIEASVVIWRRKMTNKDGKSGWGSGVSLGETRTI